ncbi:hypothetical protein QAD02_016350 [Eretmocerus hayati]|uniref:Uncharacterized protein n=1 Tax=Eretmocerus hayati TaxID=131215 RepID=A0ACC2PBU3_9HYME|nr:hypothetical protein QAD02_016350 [Eretmocerus hayati]
MQHPKAEALLCGNERFYITMDYGSDYETTGRHCLTHGYWLRPRSAVWLNSDKQEHRQRKVLHKMGLDCTFLKQNVDGPPWKNYNKVRDAVRSRDLNLVKSLIDTGVQINGILGHHCESTPLHLAVISRCPEIVKALLDNGAKIDDSDAISETPLILAAKIGNMDIIDLLLSYNVQPYHRLQDNFTHFHVACMRNNLNVVKKLMLLDNGESMNMAVSSNSVFWPGFTPLHFAVYYDCIETVDYLVESGADMMAKDAKELTPLHWANLKRNEKIIDRLLSAHKYELKNPVDPNGLTHYHIACTRDDPSVVEHFLKLGVDIDLQVQNGDFTDWNPMQFALYYECPKVIEMLLNFKVDREGKNNHGPDLLQYAFVSGNNSIYNLFIGDKLGASNCFQEIEKISDFHLACINNNVEDMRACLLTRSNSIDLDAPIWNGYSPLHLAVKYKAIDAIKFLLGRSANIEVQNSEGKTPLHLAFDYKNFDVLDVIIAEIGDHTSNVTDNVGLSFLHILCSTDQPDKVKHLLKKKIPVDIQVRNSSASWAGFTPIQVAFKFNQEHVVRVLLEYGADIFMSKTSIFDCFDQVFEDFWGQFFLPDIKKILFENLMTIFASSSSMMRYSNDCKISALHALCLNPDADLDLLKKYISTHEKELNQTIELPESREYHKCTPLHLAMRFHDFERAQLMVEAGADPLMVNGGGHTAIEFAFLFEGPFNISDDEAMSLFPVGAPIKSLKRSHFFIACCIYMFEFVNYVLDSVEDPKLKESFLNCCNDVKRTPLHSLTRQHCLEKHQSPDRISMMKLLLESGADVNAKDYLLQTPLHYASQETVLLLIDHGADVNVQNIYGETPLHTISRLCVRDDARHQKIIALLENGADINIENSKGETCLMTMISHAEISPPQEKLMIPFLEHVIKLRVLGITVNEKNENTCFNCLLYFNYVFDEDVFEDLCRKELNLMRLKDVDRYTKVLDILFKSSHEMSFYWKNSALQSLFEPSCTDFPLYKFLIRSQMRKGKMRQPLLESSTRALKFLFGRSLPRICMERILNYLSDYEVKNVILSKCKAEME